jgi:hypothetical protein
MEHAPAKLKRNGTGRSATVHRNDRKSQKKAPPDFSGDACAFKPV